MPVANELVDWFNSVDATYRAELRELNERNFARFDAKLEAFWSELLSALRTGFSEQDAKIEKRLGEQTHFLYLALAAQMAAIIGLGLRG